MSTYDLSRSATDFRKRYTSVHMQQGRVLLDDDWNENERLQAEQQRALNVEVIGPEGTPDQGFRISHPGIDNANNPNFTIEKGVYFVGGLRVEREADGTYLLQEDWLQKSGEEKPGKPIDGQGDLAYVEVWQQPVTAVEDSELLEPALGGPDTTVRFRTMHRIHLASNLGSDQCSLAWKQLQKNWKEAGRGRLNHHQQLVPDVRLTVDFEDTGNSGDLCNPPMAGGYLGAENQAIRVQLVDSTHLTWGFDNAAPLYRIQMVTGFGQKVVQMLTQPKDQAHWPLAGQIVEILPWSAVLPNHEIVAAGSGFLSRVDASYNPDKQQFSLLTPLTDGYGEDWKNRTDKAELQNFENFKDGNQFFYMRVWNRGNDVASDSAMVFQTGQAVTLGYTGLKIIIAGADLVAGDFWIIAARPETPKQVMPWRLVEGMPPHGIARYYAALGIIRWNVSANKIIGQVVSDCRETFRPLTQLRQCATRIVGDGQITHGDYDKIQAAIDSLPTTGGDILVLPGLYEESITIENRQNIILRGCGKRSRIKPPAGEPWALRILNSREIAVQDLAIEALQGYGIVLKESAEFWKSSRLRSIDLDRLEILARDRSAVLNRGGDQVRLRDCRIQVACFDETVIKNPKLGKTPAVFMTGNDLCIENNRIFTEVCSARLHTALGGIQVGGGSDNVVIRKNWIAGGNGNGITLGSVVYIGRKEIAQMKKDKLEIAEYIRIMELMEWENSWYFILPDEGGCIHIQPDPKDPVDEDGNPKTPRSEGNLTEVCIADNLVEEMGMNGIASFHLPAKKIPIAVKGLDILRNQIRQCLQITLGNAKDEQLDYWIQGGVVLSEIADARFEANRIERNGTTHVEPVCGIGILEAQAVDICKNVIRENGPRVVTTQNPKPGIRGGIVIMYVQTPYLTTAAGNGRVVVRPVMKSRSPNGMAMQSSGMIGVNDTGGSFNLPYHLDANHAARIQDNLVMAPEGRALLVLASGSVTILGNQLVSTGNYHANFQIALQQLMQDVQSKTDTNAVKIQKMLQDALNVLGGAAVSVINYGYPMDIKNQMTANAMQQILQGVEKKAKTKGMENLGASMKAGKGMFNLFAATDQNMARFLSGGNVMFNDNQVQLQLWEEGQTKTLSGLVLLSLDDISMTGNQCDCKQIMDDMVMIHGLVAAFSQRTVANRFREVGKSFLSALTLSVLNHTEHNQGTHCFMALGPQALIPCKPNRSLIQLYHTAVCEFQKVAAFLQKNLPWLGIYPTTACVSPAFSDSERDLETVLAELAKLDCDMSASQWLGSLGSISMVAGQLWQVSVNRNMEALENRTINLDAERMRAVMKYGPQSQKVKVLDEELKLVDKQHAETKKELEEVKKVVASMK